MFGQHLLRTEGKWEPMADSPKLHSELCRNLPFVMVFSTIFQKYFGYFLKKRSVFTRGSVCVPAACSSGPALNSSKNVSVWSPLCTLPLPRLFFRYTISLS